MTYPSGGWIWRGFLCFMPDVGGASDPGDPMASHEIPPWRCSLRDDN